MGIAISPPGYNALQVGGLVANGGLVVGLALRALCGGKRRSSSPQ